MNEYTLTFLANCMPQLYLCGITAHFQSQRESTPCPLLFTCFEGTNRPCPWIPNGCSTLIYNLTSQYLLDLSTVTQMREITFEHHCAYFSVTFFPGFIPTPAFKESDSLLLQLTEQTCLQKLISCFLRFLRPTDHIAFPDYALLYLIDNITILKGNVSIEQLAFGLSYSQRHIHRIFQSHMGYPPKFFCRVIRFLTALVEMQEMPDRNNSEFINHLAYSDQAHFQREFKYFTGMTPRHFIQDSKHRS